MWELVEWNVENNTKTMHFGFEPVKGLLRWQSVKINLLELIR